MTLAGAAAPEDLPLPPLRDDLRLMPAEPDEYGAPNWTIHDPVRNRYYRIGLAAFEMLSRWHLGLTSTLVDAINRETILEIGAEQVQGLIKFLHAGGLLLRIGPDAVAEFSRIAAAGRPPLWKWLVQNYLFIRIPLFRPDRFLRRTQKIADLFASREAMWVILTVGLIGIFLTLRQWDQFKGTFLQFANWQGAAWIAVTLTATKILHEFGHAYTAVRYGCRVPTMGVALLVMYPVLYTDTSDAWKLTSRTERLRIGAAGIRVELALALIATFLWHVVPDGPAKSAVFLVASTTWISTLLVNLSPFMRFDGYYLLSDALRVPNLQDRAFALARWRLREALFGLGQPAPEPWNKHRRRLLTVFAYGVWIYRFFLFLGIALLVYHLFFKALGILLFGVEIVWFILMPIVKELKVWWQHRHTVKTTPANMALLGAAAVALLMLIVPWRGTISGAAMLEAGADVPILATTASQIAEVRVKNDQAVEAGDILFVLSAPRLDFDYRASALEAREVELQLAQARVGGVTTLPDVARLEKESLRAKATLESLQARIDQLTVRAPIKGHVRDLPPSSRPGTWVKAQEALARLVAPEDASRVVAYVSQADIARLGGAREARFIADDPASPAVDILIDDIDRLGATALESPALASVHGGPIAARDRGDGRTIPLDAVYRVTGHAVNEPVDASSIMVARRGTLEIDAPAVSLLGRASRAFAAIFIRETSF